MEIKEGLKLLRNNELKEILGPEFDEDIVSLSLNDRIDKFIELHDVNAPISIYELQRWHCLITGSCSLGRIQFVNSLHCSEDAEFMFDDFIDAVRAKWKPEKCDYWKKRVDDWRTQH